jgi:hypothetical protein
MEVPIMKKKIFGRFTWPSLIAFALLVAIILLSGHHSAIAAALPFLMMGDIDIDIYDPVTMSEAVEIRKIPRTFFRDTWFNGPVRTFDTKTVLVDKIRFGEEIEVYVHPTHKGKAVGRETYKTNQVETAYLKPYRPLSFQDLVPRSPGESLDVTGSVGLLQAKAAKLLGQDLQYLDDRILRREEVMCGELLQSGTIEVSGEGIDFTVDFAMPADNQGTLVGDALWTSNNSDPFAFLYQLFRGMNIRGWRTPKTMVIGGNVVDPFITNPMVRNRLSTIIAINSGRIDPRQLADGSTFLGEMNINGFQIDVYTYDFSYTDQGVRTYAMPQDKIIIGPGETTNYFCYGAIQDLRAVETGMVESRRFPKVWEEENPSVRSVMLQSAPMPNFRESDNFACFKVI